MRKISVLALVVVLLAAVGCGPGELKEYTSKDGKFKVLMYANPTKKDQAAAGTTMHVVMNDLGSRAIVIAFADMPIPAGESDDKIQTRLDGAKNGAIKNINGTEKTSSKITLAGKHPGRAFTAELPGGKGFVKARVFLAGQRLYQVMVLGPSSFTDSDDVKKVFDSFEITN
jgi:hypothetical protein